MIQLVDLTQRAKLGDRPRYIEAALPVPLRRIFTYSVPEDKANNLRVGTRVRLPFGRRDMIGYAVAVHHELPHDLAIDESKIKPIIDVLDDEPLITPEIMRLTKWAAEYYLSFWGEMLKASLPAGINSEKIRPKRRKAVRLLRSDAIEGDKPLTEQQSKIVEILAANNGKMLWAELTGAADVSGSPLTSLAKRGIVEIFVDEVHRDPLKDSSIPDHIDVELTAEQTAALGSIDAAQDSSKFQAFLLHGITGSGKTEVYIRAMKHALANGRSAMMLVPEIALTPVFSRKLRAAFGSSVAILHSDLSQGERFDEWRRLRAGEAKIAIGTRSAVFAPLGSIGLIVVDEEHDTSYRQHESPFYNARDVAVMRANLAGAVVVLGSATPSMESFYNAQKGKYTYLKMPTRIGKQGLAQASLIDMREVFKIVGKDIALSPEMLEALRETHEKGEQSIVLLNRRGFSQFVLCRSCGETVKCQNCDITLTFHRSTAKLVCHYCNYNINAPKKCPSCTSEFLFYVGEGTESLFDQLVKRFPAMRIARVDRDSMTRKGELEQTLLDFSAGRLDMLVGTQMISKGHDFPNVTFVGVIGIDIGLGLPDLRSAERTFQLITQVAGRSGRGTKEGRVLIQTYYPDHYALRHAVAQDYEGFYAEEARFRERLSYPPYFVLASILIKHRDLGFAMKNANILRCALDGANTDRNVRILGPASASLGRLKNEYRVQLILKGKTRRSLRSVLEMGLHNAEEQGCDLKIVFTEIDPIDLM